MQSQTTWRLGRNRSERWVTCWRMSRQLTVLWVQNSSAPFTNRKTRFEFACFPYDRRPHRFNSDEINRLYK